MALPDEIVLQIVSKNNAVEATALEEIKKFAVSGHVPLATALIEKRALTDDALGKLIASHYGVPFVSLSQLTIAPEIVRLLPERVSQRQRVVIFSRDATSVKIASDDPNQKEFFGMVAKKLNATVNVFYATERDIESVLQVSQKALQEKIDELLKEGMTTAARSINDDPPVAKIVDVLIASGYRDRSSDIHIEPAERTALIRYRIDGVLHDMLTIPKSLHERVVTRIKVLSALRTDEHLSAQDGKMRINLEEENLDIRVSIIPIVEGEKVVMRLLASRMRALTLSDLGMRDTDLEKVTMAMNKSYGMILSTGPTGSGKTTSIYAILKVLNTREKNITTVEDPVEYRIKGANQVQVNVKTNLTFANGLRSILRQDPNIIFVGEIRDNETAGIAVNAALTGHLVLSTLHTNDAPTAIPRLVDMKVEPFLVASTVNVIIAQRLVRKICDMCKTNVTLTKKDWESNIPKEALDRYFKDDPFTAYKGKGCKICHFTGYNGRLGLFEVLEVSVAIRKLINDRADADGILRKSLEEGMTLMIDDGLIKVSRGLTTIEEIIRVTKVESI